MTKNGFTVNKSQIIIASPIKNLGIHTVSVLLHPEVSAPISVVVAQSEEEAALKLKNSQESETAE